MTRLNFELFPFGARPAGNPVQAGPSNPVVLIAGGALLIRIFGALMGGAI